MLLYNLKTALKFLRKNTVFTVINLLGLSIALAVSFIIILYVVNEFSYNRHHENRNNVYRVLNHYLDFEVIQTGTPYILAETLKDEFPQVKEAINVRFLRGFSVRKDNEYINVRRAVGTSSGIFDIFTLPLIGSIGEEGLLDDKYSICLSEDLARKLFENGDAVGQELTAIINNEEQILRVTAVYKDIPENSSFQASCLVNGFWNIAPINEIFEEDHADRSWVRSFWYTWILLDRNASPCDFENQFRGLEAKYHPPTRNVNYSLQNLSDIYLKSNHIIDNFHNGNQRDIMMFLSIAFLIVLVAAINYIVLSTAISTGRLKEIGIRKTNGAKPGELRTQLLVESLMLTVMVLPLAVYLMSLGLPHAMNLFQKDIHIIKGNMAWYALVYISLTLVVGLASGLYTSAWLSRQNVIKVLKSPFTHGKNKSYLRASLIVLQLVIFCFFVSSTLIINAQYRFAINKDPGFYNENIVFLNMGEDFPNYMPLLKEVKSSPYVISASGTGQTLPISGRAMIVVPHTEDPDKMVTVVKTEQDFDFLQTMGINLIQGRYFSADYGTDRSQYACIINETAVNQLGISEPIGHEIIEGFTIVGVVNDFLFQSIHHEIQPFMIILTDEYIEHIAVRYDPGDFGLVLTQLKESWEKFAPDQSFSYSLVEDLTRRLYRKEKSLITTATISATFTLLIAVMGLFGLTLFMTRLRTKEIGIKKAMGSSVAQIVFSFVRINLLYVIIAVAASTPITIIVMRQWLMSYAERVEIAWWFFAFTFVIAALVVVLTVIMHSYKAARVNPVEALRYE